MKKLGAFVVLALALNLVSAQNAAQACDDRTGMGTSRCLPPQEGSNLPAQESKSGLQAKYDWKDLTSLIKSSATKPLCGLAGPRLTLSLDQPFVISLLNSKGKVTKSYIITGIEDLPYGEHKFIAKSAEETVEITFGRMESALAMNFRIDRPVDLIETILDSRLCK